jgi:hypothetical protein
MDLASLEDIQTHLPEDKLDIQGSDVETLQIDVRRIIKGYLSGVSPFTPQVLADWADPDSTPEYIRAIAGRLIAAAYYAKRYSEDEGGVPGYAQNLYDTGMRMLLAVVTGAVELEEVSVTFEGSLTSGDFWPNDSTPGGPLFKIGDPIA